MEKIKVLPIIGMSPGNSYFKEDVISFLVKSCVEKYGSTVVFVPDVPAAKTYEALGYSQKIAWREKALPNGNLLKNRVKRAMFSFGYNSKEVYVLEWKSEIAENESLHQEYKKITELYNSNSGFRSDIRDATKQVLVGSGKELLDLEGGIDVAVEYILSEFAFMELSPDYYGCQKCVYIYHRPWPVYEKYIAGDYDGKKREYLGFEILIQDNL